MAEVLSAAGAVLLRRLPSWAIMEGFFACRASAFGIDVDANVVEEMIVWAFGCCMPSVKRNFDFLSCACSRYSLLVRALSRFERTVAAIRLLMRLRLRFD